MIFTCKNSSSITIALVEENKHLLAYRDVTILTCLNSSDEFFNRMLEFVFIENNDDLDEIYLLDSNDFIVYIVKDSLYNPFSTFIQNGIATFAMCIDVNDILLRLYKLRKLNNLWEKRIKKKILKSKK